MVHAASSFTVILQEPPSKQPPQILPPKTLNVENEDFNQRLECAAPKRRLKYTTPLRANLT